MTEEKRVNRFLDLINYGSEPLGKCCKTPCGGLRTGSQAIRFVVFFIHSNGDGLQKTPCGAYRYHTPRSNAGFAALA